MDMLKMVESHLQDLEIKVEFRPKDGSVNILLKFELQGSVDL